VGSLAPDFSVVDSYGNVRRLSDLRGCKNLLLTFFPKCFTGRCANHLTSLRDEMAALAANDVEVWAVSVDPAEGEKGQIEFAKYLKLDFPMIPDTGRNLSFLYGAVGNVEQLAMRRSVLIDKTGTIRLIDTNVVVQSHGRDILNQLTALKMLRTAN
jgi:peroxiredoxin